MTSPAVDQNPAPAATCGKTNPFDPDDTPCARRPHTDGPCSPDPDFDDTQWRAQEAAQAAEAQARWDAMSDEEKAEAERRAMEEMYDDGYTATDHADDTRAWKWED